MSATESTLRQWHKENSSLFITMLETRRHHYRRAKTITRNHQHRGITCLLIRVKHFIDTVYLFPGNGYGTVNAWHYQEQLFRHITPKKFIF